MLGHLAREETMPERSAISQQSMEDFWNRKSPYDQWVASTGVPVHEGYYIEDVRTVQLGSWNERECDAAFLKLAGQEGITEARVHEIPPGATLPSLRFSFDEAVYVIDGSTARVRVVQTGEAQNGMVRILAGLESNAVVATSALDHLFDGAAVRVSGPAARPSAGSGS